MLTRECSKCGQTKSLSDFHKSPTGKFGVRPDCKDCVRLRQQRNKISSEKAHTKYLKTKDLCACGKTKSRYAERCRDCAQPAADWKYDKQGYIVKYFNGKEIRQHRVVMEQHLNRELLPEENVHHKNGVRDDNRLENLELWSSSQPAGQRVKDKVKWAEEILLLYR
jgi:hypothetical protein